MVARIDSSLRSVSSLPDGECVSVVGQDRPSGPDLLAFVAFEAGSVQSVAAFAVPDSSFRAGSAAAKAALGALGAGLLAASDERSIGRVAPLGGPETGPKPTDRAKGGLKGGEACQGSPRFLSCDHGDSSPCGVAGEGGSECVEGVAVAAHAVALAGHGEDAGVVE